MLEEHPEVFLAFAQGRQPQVDDRQPVEQVAPEGRGLDILQQVAVGGGNDPDIQRDRVVAAQAGDAFLLQHAQQVGLGLEGHVADLVEEDGPPVGQLEFADLAVLVGAGEGAGLVAEQLALQEVAWAGRRS